MTLQHESAHFKNRYSYSFHPEDSLWGTTPEDQSTKETSKEETQKKITRERQKARP